ncbi:reverse transcriptase family protein [Cobetia amphilecti]|uniref:reverse transcriptase family protein n=1 Tax=Cobetia amphilecti TaxID=1055104 RepID=UPI0024484434|nr:reverse transcriptase family protein [Cobetia litoralis]MDH2421618.1 reverse transcriptase family protein [Cobetia litoralis]
MLYPSSPNVQTSPLSFTSAKTLAYTAGTFKIGNHSGEFRKFKLPKNKHEFRTIYCVDNKSKKYLKSYIPYLEAIAEKLDKHHITHAFMRNRNCALNAFKHVGHKHTLTIDIKDFFDSVSYAHLKGILKNNIIEDCFIDGAPRQGLSTSPLIANIALMDCDNRILSTLARFNIDCVYTRYADDLTFSFNEIKHAPKIKHISQQIIESCGFSLNKKKTRLQSLSNGRIIINGIGVDEHGIYPTRKTKKKLRAAIHQCNIRSARGLAEWSKCKLPHNMVS